MRSIGEPDVLSLIDGIYAASLDFQKWSSVLEKIADATGADDASLGAMSPTGLPWIFAPRTDPDAMARYVDYHLVDHVWHGVVGAGVGAALTDTMVMPRSDILKGQFYNEWSRPLGYRTIMGSLVLAERGWSTVIMLPGRQDYEPEQVALLGLLSPHLQRAVQINIAIAAQEASGDVSQHLMKDGGEGLLVTDTLGHVLHANRAAETWFQGEGGMTLRDGYLVAGSPSDAVQLRALMASCVSAGIADTGGHLRLSIGHDQGLDLVVAPFRAQVPLISAGQPAIMILGPPRPTPSVSNAQADARLRERYGLTAAEVAFLREIIKGDGKHAAAQRRNISYTTARTHLSRIFDKTGVNRQAELVRLILEIEGTG